MLLEPQRFGSPFYFLLQVKGPTHNPLAPPGRAGSAQGAMTCPSECINQVSASIKGEEFLDQLREELSSVELTREQSFLICGIYLGTACNIP